MKTLPVCAVKLALAAFLAGCFLTAAATGVRAGLGGDATTGNINPSDLLTEFDSPGAGTAAGEGTQALDVDQDGNVVGFFKDAQNVFHGFMRTAAGSFITIDEPDAGTVGDIPGTRTHAINNNGMITGDFSDANGFYHGFIRASDGTFTAFDAPDAGPSGYSGTQGTFTSDLNDNGQIAGRYSDVHGFFHAYLRQPDGAFVEFDGLEVCSPNCLNSDGTIVGSYALNPRSFANCFLRQPTGEVLKFGPKFTARAVFGSQCSGINDQGTVVGSFYGKVILGFMRNAKGVSKVITVPGSEAVDAAAINASGAIAGTYYIVKNPAPAHAFSRLANGKVMKFDAPGAGTKISQGTFPISINAQGIIVGYYVDANNVSHGFTRQP